MVKIHFKNEKNERSKIRPNQRNIQKIKKQNIKKKQTIKKKTTEMQKKKKNKK